MSRVTILGCGPAGLLACHAASEAGHEVRVLSVNSKSPIGGAQYLHNPIEGLTGEPDLSIVFSKIGDREGYAEKVYGLPTAPCSWDEFPEGLVRVWSLRRAYDELWARYAHLIFQYTVVTDDVLILLRSCDLLISTIPLMSICGNSEHDFMYQPITLRKSSLARHPASPGMIIYNGDPDAPWYRMSAIDGEQWIEYAGRVAVPDAVKGVKPLSTNCNCHPQMVRVGRFGRWSKGVLVHEAFDETRKSLALLGDPS